MRRRTFQAMVVAVFVCLPETAVGQGGDQVLFYHTDAIGSVRRVTDASGQVVAEYDYLPFGQPWQSSSNPDEPRRFGGKELDTETGLDYFGARYYASGAGRFTTVDPVLPVEAALLDPQLWNRYAYARNGPLRYIDPDGREVQVLDEEALRLIRSTFAENLRSNIILDKRGFIDRRTLNRVKTDDENFTTLRALVNTSQTLQVSTASGVDLETGFATFFFESAAEIARDLRSRGVDTTGLPLIDNQFLGFTDRLSRSRMRVTLSDGKGRASGAPFEERSITTAHEIYGHAYLGLFGRPWTHDSGGAVDRRILEIERRTRLIHGKR